MKRISVGGSFARAAMTGFIDAAREVRDHDTFTYSGGIISGSKAGAFLERGPR